MTNDSSGGLHYSRDERGPVAEPDFTFSNPHKQRVGPRWVRGEIVYAMPMGVIHIDPSRQKWAKEYVLIYSLEGPDGNSERVQGQFGIYDSRPGDPGYSPIWRYYYVIVPRDYEANSIRSEEDVLSSGFEVIQADRYTN